jgi:hypothetical protein
MALSTLFFKIDQEMRDLQLKQDFEPFTHWVEGLGVKRMRYDPDIKKLG